MIAIPKKAATIILLRDKKPEGFEIFLLKRHEKSSFMGGNFVYPGGRVDIEDGSLEIRSLCKGISIEEAQKIFGSTISHEDVLAHLVSGIRELFEEAGVLLAYDENGNLIQLKNQEDREKFLNYRNCLQNKKMTFGQVAHKENLLLALDQLHYYAHWITPEARSERFDTRFFLARYPIGQKTSFDQNETIAEIWLTPLEALEENLKGKVALSPPTLKTLEDLSRFKTVDDVFTSLKKYEIGPILPILTRISGEPTILFPWDPEYEIFQRGEIPTNIDHGRPSQPSDNTTRLILREGIWYPYYRAE